MAQIDLKNARIYFRDGYAGPGGDNIGAVNNVAGYAAGATVLAIGGITGMLNIGDIITIAGSVSGGELVHHRITAHTETTGNTTSITVSPALAAAVLDAAVITVLPHEIEVKIGEGNLTYSEKKAREYIRDRGRLSTVRNADEEPIDVSIDFIWEFIKAESGKPPTIEDVLKQRGEAASWVSSATDQCEPYAVDLYLYHNTPCATDKDEELLIQDFRYEELNHDLRAGTIAATGKANVLEAVATRI